MTTDWAALYGDNVAAVCALTRGLSDDELARPVAGTPLWTPREVLAHLAGVAADGLSGRTGGAPGPEWTARHVGERADRTVDELATELEGLVGECAALITGPSSAGTVFDVSTHHADLHEALGRGAVPEHFWAPVVETIAPHRAPELVGVVPAYELFRGLFSRRSRAQMAAWGTDVGQERLDEVCIFGPRDDDQPAPA
jgi:hypothetical protein